MPTIYDESESSRKKNASGIQKNVSQKRPMGPLTSYAEHPTHVHFETQDQDEEVALFLRQHFIVNASWIFLTIVMLISPTILFPLFFRLVELPVAIPPMYILVGTAAWYLGTFGFALSNFIHWYFNIYIITNERIVDIDFINLLYKHFTQAELYRVQEISFVTGGISGTFFNFGEVFIQTAGEKPNIEFTKVPQPERVVQVIRHQIEKLGRRI